jgi:hypothetical protein
MTPTTSGGAVDPLGYGTDSECGGHARQVAASLTPTDVRRLIAIWRHGLFIFIGRGAPFRTYAKRPLWTAEGSGSAMTTTVRRP